MPNGWPGPEDVSKRDFAIGLVCVAVLIVVALIALAWLIAQSTNEKSYATSATGYVVSK